MISCVDSVTMKGCSLNLATQKPLTRPTMPPTAITTTSTITTGQGPIPARKRLARSDFCRRMAETNAPSPTTRPAERSVPVRMMAPAMPSAMGRRVAVSWMMLTIDAVARKAGR